MSQDKLRNGIPIAMISEISKKTGLPYSMVAKVIHKFHKSIKAEIKEGNDIEWYTFGHFMINRRERDKRVNRKKREVAIRFGLGKKDIGDIFI